MTPKKAKIPKKPSMPAPTQPGKDTLYIDVEDEITTVIDKVENAKNKVVAIVLPKRAATFQSIVNLKLLKKAATAEKKNIVLITSDQAIMHVAAIAKIHVAPTPTSKPIIPVPAHAQEGGKETDLAADSEDTKDSKEKKAAFAATGAAATAVALSDDAPIEIDNTTDLSESLEEAVEKPAKAKKGIKIPDFGSFRVRMALAIGGVLLLIVLWVFGFVVLPKATVTLNTNFRTLPVNTTITTNLDAEEVDLDTNTVPAKRAQTEKISKLDVGATGEKNIGEKATGTMTLTNCIDDGESKVVPAGTQFSSDSLTFVSTKQVILPPAITSGGQCVSDTFGLSRDVGAQAAEPGPQYNLSSRGYNSAISGITAFGSDMSGGTTKNVKVISQSDVDRAVSELGGSSKNEALSELRSELSDAGVQPIDGTFDESEPEILATPAVGEEADSTEVTVTVNYSLTGVSEEHIAQILEADIQKNIEDTSQNIRDNGLSEVQYGLSDSVSEGEKILTLQTIATIGPDIDVEQLKTEIAGKSRGEIENKLEAIDGVRSVSVEYSPVWITTTPKSPDKIEIVFNEETNE